MSASSSSVVAASSPSYSAAGNGVALDYGAAAKPSRLVRLPSGPFRGISEDLVDEDEQPAGKAAKSGNALLVRCGCPRPAPSPTFLFKPLSYPRP
jgi:hypothetical protein